MADDVERTEDPTPKRRNEARAEGQLAISQEAFVFANLFAVSLTLLFVGPQTLATGISLTHALWRPRSDISLESTLEILGLVGAGLASILTPVLLSSVFGAVAIGELQTRGNIATKRLRPKFSKLSPSENFKRIVKRQALIDLPKSIMKIAAVSTVIWFAIHTRLDEYLGLIHLPLVEIAEFQLGTILVAYLAGCAMLLVIAIIDYAYQYWRTEQSMKMSKTEVKEERKQSEGDPMVKSRLRSLQFERARSRMMEAVPKADVVVTNPTHVSIALKYERENMSAPKVVARGAGILALRIREIAQLSGVPLVENPPLARSLYRATKVGDYVPERLYRAVAETLAYVYRMDQRRSRSW